MTHSLNDWLERISRHHPAEISLGLERCQQVFKRITSSQNWSIPTITVAGTNGKGSTIAYLEALALTSDLTVLTFTSPHLIDYRERLCLNGNWLSEQQHIEAFEFIEQQAGEIPLTYFEFSTLSAFYWAEKLNPDLLLLEVGLGGRLDATNLVAPDVAVVTTVDFDHQEFLGDTLEQIATEKLGIVHPSSYLVLADHSVPEPCLERLNCHGIYRIDEQYAITTDGWRGPGQTEPLSLSRAIQPQTNAAAALMAFKLVFTQQLDQPLMGLVNRSIRLSGRQQIVRHSPEVMVDVAHNPQAMTHLMSADFLLTRQPVWLLLGMLKDKNVRDCIRILKPHVERWFICDLNTERGLAGKQLKVLVEEEGISLATVSCYASVDEAYQAALTEAKQARARLIVTGSFYTVGPVLERETIDVN